MVGHFHRCHSCCSSVQVIAALSRGTVQTVCCIHTIMHETATWLLCKDLFLKKKWTAFCVFASWPTGLGMSCTVYLLLLFVIVFKCRLVVFLYVGRVGANLLNFNCYFCLWNIFKALLHKLCWFSWKTHNLTLLSLMETNALLEICVDRTS